MSGRKNAAGSAGLRTPPWLVGWWVDQVSAGVMKFAEDAYCKKEDR